MCTSPKLIAPFQIARAMSTSYGLAANEALTKPD